MNRIFLLFLIVLSLAGCAMHTKYVPYTDQRFIPKPKYYFVTVYSNAQRPPATEPYTVIGRVEVSGYISDGVNADTLTDQAKAIARKRGADAIINAKSEAVQYNGVYVEPGNVERYRWRHYYHPAEYIPYQNIQLTFRGDLIVFIQPQ